MNIEKYKKACEIQKEIKDLTEDLFPFRNDTVLTYEVSDRNYSDRHCVPLRGIRKEVYAVVINMINDRIDELQKEFETL